MIKSTQKCIHRLTCLAVSLLTVCFGSGCQSDECIRLCTAASRQLDTCQEDWNIDWRYLDAYSATAFENVCQESWSEAITNYEWRERVEAEAQCDEVLTQVNSNEIECVDLQVLYFFDPQ
jgi:hypothetical protein